MPRTKRKPVPRFKTAEQEHAFWAGHDVTEYVNMAKGSWGIPAERYPSKTRAVSIRLPETLLANLRRLAHARDVAYQALIKLWLAERLTQERLLQSRIR